VSALHQLATEHHHPQADPHAEHAHSVQLYGSDERSLTINVARYIADGLRRGEGVVVIAEPAHTAAFLRQLQMVGAEPYCAVQQKQLAFHDAETTLDSILAGGNPDRALFEQVVGAAVNEVRGWKDDREKRAYGEMVGVLWRRGETAAAIRLEEIWNEYILSAKFQLFCGYPIDIFGAEFQSHPVEQILLNHTHVISTGADGDLERAVRQAMEDVTPAHSGVRYPDAPPFSARMIVPKAETAILALREEVPERTHEVLTRARRYYETEKRFRALIENSSDAVLLMDPDGRILYASPSTARVLGYSPEEITGSNCFDLIHPSDSEKVRQSIAGAIAAPHEALQFELRVRRSAGDWRWLDGTVTDLSDDQAVRGIVWNCRDVTERLAAEQALLESQRRLATRERYLQTVLDSMPDCVKVLGRKGEVLEMNAAGLRMLEADDPEQVLGRCVYPVIDEADRAAFQSLNESVFNGGSGGSLEFSIVGLKGSRRTFETNVVPLRDEADRIVGALSATRDVTERKAAEVALRRANDGLEQFAYAAAHDLQEPIRNVILYTEILADRYRSKLDRQAQEFMATTVEGARRMEALVHDLLAYSRSIDKPGDRQPGTDANEVAADVLLNLQTAIEAASAEVLCGSLPALPIYRVHLVQLLQNLVGNALKYKSDKLPRVEIFAEERPDEFAITVRDNGPGIPEGQRERIFGIFKRLHDRSVPGNGIGLAICRRIISHYEGRIWVESQEGQGSSFVFTLPRHRPQRPV
jgi:PAS domain S-box-containing protein